MDEFIGAAVGLGQRRAVRFGLDLELARIHLENFPPGINRNIDHLLQVVFHGLFFIDAITSFSSAGKWFRVIAEREKNFRF
ncbi:hypothetical protein [Candidatus Spongiihabitans sp.]|uniref:hypothetical protein n=1 Tax=Candidatus Spongiihabitans sp. TaxID=3101308 RepID=UPI003C704647